MSTSNVAVWVGLDFHQRRTQVCGIDQKGQVLCNRSVPSRIGEITRAIEPLGKARLVAIEAVANRWVGWLYYQMIESIPA